MVLGVEGSNPIAHPTETAGAAVRPETTAGPLHLVASDFGSGLGANPSIGSLPDGSVLCSTPLRAVGRLILARYPTAPFQVWNEQGTSCAVSLEDKLSERTVIKRDITGQAGTYRADDPPGGGWHPAF